MYIKGMAWLSIQNKSLSHESKVNIRGNNSPTEVGQSYWMKIYKYKMK